MGSFHHFYTCILNCLSDDIYIGTFRITVLHEHAGTQVHDIDVMFFQGIQQAVNPPARAASASEKGNHLCIFAIDLKMRLSFIESLKAAHPRAGFRDYITADDCDFCWLCLSSQCSTVLNSL